MRRCNALTAGRAGLIVVALLLPTDGLGATYYVRTSGDDDNNGQSANQAWETLEKAADMMDAGDTVYVGAGTYREQLLVEKNGTGANPIRFIADTSGALTGDAGVVQIARNGKNPLRVSGDYVEIVGFRLYGSKGVWWDSGAGGLLQECEIDGHALEGLQIDNAQVAIIDCDIHDNGKQGLLVGGDATLTIVRSSFRDNGTFGLDLGSSASTTFSFSACMIHGNKWGGFVTGGGAGTITNSLIHNNDGLGVDVDSNAAVTIWNSTIASNANEGIRQTGGTLTVTNSILANNGSFGLLYQGGTITHTYNLFFDNVGGQHSGIAADPTEITAAPKFEDILAFDYHPMSTSPALDAGVNAAGTVDDDLDGNARPLGAEWDMGCYEVLSGGASGNEWRILQWIEIPKP